MEEYEVVLYHWNQGSLNTRCLVFQVIDPSFCFFMLDVDSFIPIEMFPIDTDPNTCCPVVDRLHGISWCCYAILLGLGMVETIDPTRVTCFIVCCCCCVLCCVVCCVLWAKWRSARSSIGILFSVPEPTQVLRKSHATRVSEQDSRRFWNQLRELS